MTPTQLWAPCSLPGSVARPNGNAEAVLADVNRYTAVQACWILSSVMLCMEALVKHHATCPHLCMQCFQSMRSQTAWVSLEGCADVNPQDHELCDGLHLHKGMLPSINMSACMQAEPPLRMQGVCYHLYSQARSESMAEFQLAELQRCPLEELCLQVYPTILHTSASSTARA